MTTSKLTAPEESFANIPRLHPGVRRVIPVAIRRWRKRLTQRETWQEIRAFRQELQRECYDLVIDTGTTSLDDAVDQIVTTYQQKFPTVR